MKRFISLLLTVITVLCLSCCKDNENPSSSTAVSDTVASDISSDMSSDLSSDTESVSSTDERYTDMVAREEPVLDKMHFGKVFYRSKQATNIYLVNITELDDDTVNMLRSLQGLVARNHGGAIYLDDGSVASRFWIDYCSSEYGLNFKDSTPSDVINKFARYIKGAVLYSDEVDYEYTVAQNISIQSDYLVATGLSISLVNPALSNKPLVDIRNQFADKKAAYNYIMENCLPTSSTRYLGIVGKSAAFSDYVYAVKALVLDFDFSEKWESDMLSLITGRPDWNETAYVFSDRSVSTALLNVFSANGFAVINVGEFTNCTLFSSITAKYNTRTRKYEMDKLTANKIYVSMYLNVESMADIQQTAYTVWNCKTAASRISVEYYPVLYELAPPIAKWFKQNRTSNDMLISADLGCGSANLSLMDEKTAELFRANNQYFLNASGITVISTDTDMYAADDYDDEMSDLLAPETENNITARMRFTDADSIESWLSTAVPVSKAPMYFLIELPSAEFDGETFTKLGEIITDVKKEREGIFEFVLTENLLEYM